MTQDNVNVAALLPVVGGDFVVEERPLPSPGSRELLIHNHFIGVNPVDWKRWTWGFMITSLPTILGADVCGVVAQVGSSVTAFKVGDRVIGTGDSFSSGNISHAAFQKYTIVHENSAARIPDEISLQEGATLPTPVGAAAMALFDVLGMPLPDKKNFTNANASLTPSAILIWGGASCVGTMTIQLARILGLTVFTTASERHHSRLRSLGADFLFDYHSPTVVQDITDSSERAGKGIVYVVDTVSSPQTLELAFEVLSAPATSKSDVRKLAHLTPWPQGLSRPHDIEVGQVHAEQLWDRRRDLSVWLFNDTLPVWLKTKAIVPLKYRLVDGGLQGLQTALAELKQGVSGEKLLVEV